MLRTTTHDHLWSSQKDDRMTYRRLVRTFAVLAGLTLLIGMTGCIGTRVGGPLRTLVDIITVIAP